MRYALIIIDMVVDFVTGKFGNPYAQKIVPNIKELINSAHHLNIPIIYLRDAHTPGDKELEVWGEHAMEGEKGSEIIPELSPEEKDYVIKKKVYSGFYKTELEELLRELNVDTVVLTGTSTHICVIHNSADAFFRGFNVIVVSDATASFIPEEHERALKYMKEIHNAKLYMTGELIERWES
ncbi:MAG TPA: isochorismatase family cysteine hydrolase [Dictyoglomaceae bacterium]|nr:isochorismatase family cysteine hydrolase [Dictyoglomaceae bacterium]HOL39994.1 isochorismatase family cysteine hydrolase [Dictyoglomaceae bacterium]HOP95220.1 isochorismatase family cysteine hydrolase [Dictyoglomaceae bacterium]HPP16584.1 isochorismatase family cysteine hydrolase [Dictyoglomaceae bacterium]HPU43752.1 isochorismatase family cysteine hydrolase [Dictyoglomaceae bacterium]